MITLTDMFPIIYQTSKEDVWGWKKGGGTYWHTYVNLYRHALLLFIFDKPDFCLQKTPIPGTCRQYCRLTNLRLYYNLIFCILYLVSYWCTYYAMANVIMDPTCLFF